MKMMEAHPAVLQMFHGTSAHNAKRIVADGRMRPDPEDRHYGEDSEDLASLDGSYFADNLEAAIGYAYRASMEWSEPGILAVIVADVPLAQGVPDEDVIGLAMEDALRKTRNPDQFVMSFHKHLVQDRPIPINKTAVMALYRAYRKYKDTGEGYNEYREALDAVAHAYAEMIFDTHPVYLGGSHTVRLPNGISLEHITSVTIFELLLDEDGVPTIKDVRSIHGKTISLDRLQEAAYDLSEDGFFEPFV